MLNPVQAVLNSLKHLQEPRAVLNSLLSLGAQVNDLWTTPVLHGRHTPMRKRVLHSLAYPQSGSESPPS